MLDFDGVVNDIEYILEKNKYFPSVREAGYDIHQDCFIDAEDLLESYFTSNNCYGIFETLLEDGTINAFIEEMSYNICNDSNQSTNKYYHQIVNIIEIHEDNLNLNTEENDMYTPLDIKHVDYWTINGKKSDEYSDTSLLSIIKDLKTAEENIKSLDVQSARKNEMLDEIRYQTKMIVKELDSRIKAPSKN